PAETATEEYIERIQAYMTKALKEAKLNTSWIQPNEEWDSATSEFIAKILAPEKNKFLPTFLPVAEEIARLGAMNSLAQVVLKLTTPGVPDIYQGQELWDFSLVDPDNRRPVDYGKRREMFARLASAAPEELLRNWADGRIKMFVTSRLLHLRRELPQLFKHGTYVPLAVSGTHAESCVAFAREHEGNWLLVIAPRLSSRVGFPPIGEAWQDTAVQVPESLANSDATDLFTGRPLQVESGSLKLVHALADLPFAVFRNTGF
ncbi:MAG: malto-oligosyltrehalose synthase, partial [Chthoniobacterales bacterium]|nr:malto-oligosyltrehalose synthase [Chthoniobacterales bacterium]